MLQTSSQSYSQTTRINLFISHKDPDFLISILNCELIKLSNLFRANRLSLNLNYLKHI